MFDMTVRIPKNETVNIAFSGGVDSLAMALLYKKMKYNVKLYHFNHGCEYSDDIEKGCWELSEKLELPLQVLYIDVDIDNRKSIEDQWRRARYRALYEAIGHNEYLLTAHHLNDSVETWIFSSLHGNGKIIEPYQEIEYNGKLVKLVRPLLMSTKERIISFVDHHGFVPVPDECNKDMGLMRNYIRNVMMEHVHVVNPGIEKVIRKKYLDKLNRF